MHPQKQRPRSYKKTMPKRKSNRTTSAAAKLIERGSNTSNNEGGADGGNDDDDEVVARWKKLQETQRKKMKHLEEETEQLQHEKDTMLQSVMLASASSPGGTTTTIHDDDIIEVDAGGKILRALRSTLTLPPNTMWSYMFSGRWDGSLKRDSDGRIFLDYNHELIEIIVDYLRMKKVEDPADPLEYPHVPPHKAKDFERLLEYFGLVDYFNPPIMFSAANFIVQHGGNNFVAVTDNDDNTVKLLFKQKTGCHYGVACSTELDPAGEGCFWKVTIDSLSSSHGCFLGIVGNLNVKYYVPSRATSFGWNGKARVSTKAIHGKDWFAGFEKGECLYFHFKSNKLRMHSIQKNKTFVFSKDDFDTNATKYYFHILYAYKGTAMTIGSLTAEERKTFTDDK